MIPGKDNLLYFNKQAVYIGYLWHPFVSPTMILPVLLNACYRYLALKDCDIVLFKLANEDKSTKGQRKVENVKEMAKKELLELCKANLSAQAANHAWDKFKNLINNTAKSLNLEGKEGTL